MQSFAQNILNLDISDQLLTMVNDAETYARERVYKAEEELEGVAKFVYSISDCYCESDVQVCIKDTTLMGLS